MRNKLTIAVAMTFGLLALAASPAWAQKNSAVATFSAPFTGNDTITASISKGKKKRLLLANATATIEDGIVIGDFCDLVLQLDANGVVMSTAVSFNNHTEVRCQCSSGCIGCTATTTAYLDLDAAEEANPGVFLKQPIDVDLRIVAGGTGTCAGGSDDAATLVVQMIKK